MRGNFMLTFDFRAIGNRLHAKRKIYGMTQLEVAAAAELSERTYADIERGNVNMRIETLLRICDVLHITPDEILTEEDSSVSSRQDELIERLNTCSPKDRETALNILAAYLKSLE